MNDDLVSFAVESAIRTIRRLRGEVKEHQETIAKLEETIKLNHGATIPMEPTILFDVDGRIIYSDRVKHMEDLLRLMEREISAAIGDGTGHVGSIGPSVAIPWLDSIRAILEE